MRGVVICVVVLMAAAACSPSPSPSVLPSPSTPSPSASPSVAAKPIYCNPPPPQVPLPTRLSCYLAVAAARAAIADRVPSAEILSFAFHFAGDCSPLDMHCPYPSPAPDRGYVIVSLFGPDPDLLVAVSADEQGVVTVTSVDEVPIPTST